MTLAIGFLLILHNQLYTEDSSGTGEPSRPEGIFAVCGHTTHCYTEAWETNPSLQDDSVQLHFYLTKPLLPFRSREQRLAEMVISATADHITDSPSYTSTLYLQSTSGKFFQRLVTILPERKSWSNCLRQWTQTRESAEHTFSPLHLSGERKRNRTVTWMLPVGPPLCTVSPKHNPKPLWTLVLRSTPVPLLQKVPPGMYRKLTPFQLTSSAWEVVFWKTVIFVNNFCKS